jgi:Protein of unknown function (DUF3306)
MSNDRDSEPFLSRWSRQKQQQAKQPEAKQSAVPAKPDEPEPEIDLSKLTKVEDLTAESDITQFLQKGVPDALQKLALRKMWSLDPQIRDFVEVAENQWDFNMPGGIHGLFEELADGTDTSVWMAQATQSVFGDEAKKRDQIAGQSDGANVAAEPSAMAENAAPQQEGLQVSAEALVVANARRSGVSVGQQLPAQQASVVAEKLTIPAIVQSSEPQPPMRRHGGALPA